MLGGRHERLHRLARAARNARACTEHNRENDARSDRLRQANRALAFIVPAFHEFILRNLYPVDTDYKILVPSALDTPHERGLALGGRVDRSGNNVRYA